jgi:hypothetical protein
MRLSDWSNILKPVDLSSAWLAIPFGDTAAPAAEFKGDPNKAVWLPNEKIAKIWMEYVRTGTISSTSTPPAPFNLKVKAGTSGNEITWDAEVDLANGLGGFIVLRDGRGIARLPAQPPGQVYGRPLFQGLSYHDTPFAPLPQMRHLDASPPAGGKNIYTVIALNSGGVPSVASLPAAVQ